MAHDEQTLEEAVASLVDLFGVSVTVVARVGTAGGWPEVRLHGPAGNVVKALREAWGFGDYGNPDPEEVLDLDCPRGANCPGSLLVGKTDGWATCTECGLDVDLEAYLGIVLDWHDDYVADMNDQDEDPSRPLTDRERLIEAVDFYIAHSTAADPESDPEYAEFERLLMSLRSGEDLAINE